MKSFGSDNHAPVHPDVLAAIVAANDGDAPSYGADPWTEEARRLFTVHFGPDAEAHLVFNGTGANVLSLGTRWQRLSKTKPWLQPAQPERLGNLLQQLTKRRPALVFVIERLVVEILAHLDP